MMDNQDRFICRACHEHAILNDDHLKKHIGLAILTYGNDFARHLMGQKTDVCVEREVDQIMNIIHQDRIATKIGLLQELKHDLDP